jgi:hypothetical protein
MQHTCNYQPDDGPLPHSGTLKKVRVVRSIRLGQKVVVTGGIAPG